MKHGIMACKVKKTPLKGVSSVLLSSRKNIRDDVSGF